MTITQYIDSLNQRYQLGNETERAFRGDLQSLVKPSLPLKPPSMRSRTSKLRLPTPNLTSTALRLTSKTPNLSVANPRLDASNAIDDVTNSNLSIVIPKDAVVNAKFDVLNHKQCNDRNNTGKVYINETYYFNDVSEIA